MNKDLFVKAKDIYKANQRRLPVWGKSIAYMAIVFFGAFLGYASEWLEYTMQATLTYQGNYILDGLVFVFNGYSLWIFCATVIAYNSWNPLAAGVQAFSFLVSMCIGYFIPKHMHYGYSVLPQFLMWSIIAAVAMLPAAIIWFSRYTQKMGAIIKAIPIAAILGEWAATVYRCIDYYNPIPGGPKEPLKWLLMPERITQLGIYILFALALIFMLAKGMRRRAQLVLLAVLFGLVFALLFALL